MNVTIICTQCGRPLPDGVGMSTSRVGGLYCSESCVMKAEAARATVERAIAAEHAETLRRLANR